MKIIVCHSVDGWKQHEYLKKEDAASHTVSTESVFITLSIEACKGRNAVTHDSIEIFKILKQMKIWLCYWKDHLMNWWLKWILSCIESISQLLKLKVRTALVCESTKGSLWTDLRAFLYEAAWRIGKLWIYHKAIHPLYVKQDCKWRAYECHMERGWLEGTPKGKHGNN